MKNDDVVLIQRVLAGDETAFTELVNKYQKPVHTLAWRKIGDFHIAEDITQETFLKVYQRLHTLKDPHQFSGWLYVITANLCATWLRKKRIRTQPLEDTALTMTQRDAYSQHIVEERTKTAAESQREVVKQLLAKLKESERTVMTLYYLGEMTVAEISRFLGVSTSTIKSRLRRARHRLQKEEPMIREALEHFQITPNLTENIMREISRLKPITPSGSKPLVPWAIGISTLAVILLMFGVGTQSLSRFQKPYSFDAASEMKVELIDAPIVLNLESEPDNRTQLGNVNAQDKNNGIGNQAESENVPQKEKPIMPTTPPQDMSHITIDLAIKRGVHSVAFSPDGSIVASDKDNTVRLSDAVTGEEIKMAENFWVAFLGNFTADINSVAFSPDGRMIAGGIDESEVICLWDTATGEQLRFMKENAPNGLHWVNTVAFSRDSKILASGSEDGNLYLWDVETGKRLKALTEDTENIFSVVFSSDGKTLASGNAGNTVRLWDIDTGEKLETLIGHTNWVFSVAFNPDGRTLASGSWDKTIRLWDTTTKQQLKTFTGHTSVVWSVAFSPDGLTLASGSEDKTIRLWNVATGVHIATLTGHTAPVKSVAFSPDGVTLASGSKDGTVRLWDLTSPLLLRKDN